MCLLAANRGQVLTYNQIYRKVLYCSEVSSE
nr:hypothetical protein [uncultured Schaedlerella sp.]